MVLGSEKGATRDSIILAECLFEALGTEKK
jgi:hypothetical protein